ncbi:MAG: hypothetical protein Q9170_004404, partial [Blastenia crenularia]
MADKNNFFSVACRIDTLVRSASKTDKAENISIFQDDQFPLSFDKLSSLPIDLVYGTWAKLLHSYVYKDTISFGLLSTSEDEDARDMRESSFRYDTARICQYHDFSERNWGEWSPDAYRDISRKTLEETQINTAICLRGARQMCESHPQEKSTGSEPIQDSIARTFQTILLEIVTHHGHDLRRISLISKPDREQIRMWNDRELYNCTSSLHGLIEATCLAKPDSEAICAWDGSMTYAELHTLSSDVARRLIRAGVCLGDMIPFAFEKSKWTVVALLAILKAGGAFVPLLPTHPKQRLEDIIASVQAKVVLTSEQYLGLFGDISAQVMEVSAATIHVQSDCGTDDVCFPNVGPRDVVFILFTSGSTGKPKGVVHEHGPISTHAIMHGEAMGYHGARVIQFAAHVFDLSILDMTTTLIFGGCICIPSEEDRVNNISEVMNRMTVDLAMLTPSFANLLRPDDLTTLKTLICCGECYKEEIVNRWKGKIRLINCYGPAETQFTNLRDIEDDNDTTRPSLTVGPLLPTAICVLVDPSNHDRLVPIGGVGELLVAATTLARGYLNDEHKTNAAFISNPLWAAELGFQAERFYKTGDMLRYNVGSFDGQLDWVGRKDSQIKIHGQRFEVGEIEHHLARIPGLAASLVAFPDQGCFSGQLVAVVQMETPYSPRVTTEPLEISGLDRSLSTDTVRAHLLKTLPSYAVPSECLTIERMPLTSNCKLDRKTVDSWLGSLVSRPSIGDQVAVEAKADISPLEAHETTAHAISGAVADMVASRDVEQGLQLQGHDFVLQSSGMDSIQVMSLSMFVRKSYGVKLAMDHFHSSSSTIRSLAYLIDQEDEPADSGTSGLDLVKEIESHLAKLLDDIKPIPKQLRARRVLLTGASGYLGSGIVHKLLSESNVDVYALMRYASTADGLDVIASNAKAHGWWRADYAARLHIWPGDLTKPKLGLGDGHLQYFEMGNEQHMYIDTIIHNGARVHYNTDYHGLKATNLHPTRELLSLLAGSPNISTFIYVSGGRCLTFEEDETDNALLRASDTNGYGQSKFVSESIVRKCMDHAAFASKYLHIVQPGYIIGSPSNGIANLTDFIWRLVAGCLEIGAYNAEESNHWLFIADVDRVAEAITQPIFANSLSNEQTSASSRTNRIRDGFPFAALWHLLEHDFGYTLQPLPQKEWLSRLEALVLAAGPTHMLFPLLATLEKSAGNVGTPEDVPTRYRESSLRALDAAKANVRYLISQGFFVAPEQQPVAVSPEGVGADGGSGME